MVSEEKQEKMVSPCFLSAGMENDLKNFKCLQI